MNELKGFPGIIVAVSTSAVVSTEMAGFAEDVVVEEDNVGDTKALAGTNGLFEIIPCAGSVNACGIEELAVGCVVTLAVEIASGVVNR